ncbi:cupin domain-containing protein [Streptomyces sp. NPDC056160]|uniref:cupin domain-containing protein n=1 Tax=Streptomyces sp. NPDC056160 TaxID=3345731 RepID=UPI0035E00BA9
MSLRDLGFSVGQFSGGWPDRAMRATAQEAVRAVLTPDDVDELVAARGLRMPAFRMARDGKLVNPRHYTLASGSDTASTVGQLADAEGIARQLGRGSTLVLQGLQRFHPPAGRLTRALAGDLGARVFANAYLTPGSAQGFAEHTDPYSAFLVQLAGAKRWLVRPSAQAPVEEVILRPLDVLWLPAGWLHAGVALSGSPSVHLTLAVNPLPLTDVVTAITESLARQVDGETLPPLPAGDAHQVLEREVDRLAVRLRAALGGVDTKELARTLLARSAEGEAAPVDRVSTALGFVASEATGDGGT